MSNMEIFADYHTHTTFSHGKGTIEENVLVAISKGLKEVAITDHGLSHIAYGLKKSRVKEARGIVDALNQKYGEKINVLFGIEANLISIDGDIDVYPEFKSYFDIVLLGYHNLARFNTGSLKHFVWDARWSGHRRDSKYVEISTNAFIKAIEKNHVDMLSHPSDPVTVNMEQLAKACAKTGTCIEINCKHKSMSVETLQTAMKAGAKFVINTDAHKACDVGEFAYGIDLAQKANIPKELIINAK